MIKLYGHPKTRSDRIQWMLEELGLEYEFKLIDFAKGDSRSPEFLAINPAGKVPALQDDELVLLESAAIVTYLGDKYPESGLVPRPGGTERAKYEQWAYFAMAELEQPLWTMGKHKFALPKDKRVPEVLETAAWEFQKALKLLSEGLGEQDYILGNSFSAADILLAHTLIWGMAFKQPIEQANLSSYIERVKDRAAFKAMSVR